MSQTVTEILAYLQASFPTLSAEQLAETLAANDNDPGLAIVALGEAVEQAKAMRLVERFPQLEVEHVFAFVRQNPAVPEQDFIDIFANLTPVKPAKSRFVVVRAGNAEEIQQLRYNFGAPAVDGPSSCHLPPAVAEQEGAEGFFDVSESLLEQSQQPEHHRTEASRFHTEMARYYERAAASYQLANQLGRSTAAFLAEQGAAAKAKMMSHNKVAAYLHFKKL